MGVGDQFDTGEGLTPLKLLLLGGQIEIIVVPASKMLVGCNHEAEGPAGGIAAALTESGLNELHHGVDERPWREVLPGSGLLFVGVLLQQPFVQVAEAFFPGAVPVQAVDIVDDLFEILGFVDVGVSVDVYLLDPVLPFSAQLEEQLAVVLVQLDAFFGGEVRPAAPCRDLGFSAGFLCHLEKEDVGQFGHVLVIGDAVVAEHVAEVPELLNDFVGGQMVAPFTDRGSRGLHG